MYKDPIYFYFIVPTLLLVFQIMVVIVFCKLKEVLKNLFIVNDSGIIPNRNDMTSQKVCRQTELLKQGGN